MDEGRRSLEICTVCVTLWTTGTSAVTAVTLHLFVTESLRSGVHWLNSASLQVNGILWAHVRIGATVSYPQSLVDNAVDRRAPNCGHRCGQRCGRSQQCTSAAPIAADLTCGGRRVLISARAIPTPGSGLGAGPLGAIRAPWPPTRSLLPAPPQRRRRAVSCWSGRPDRRCRFVKPRPARIPRRSHASGGRQCGGGSRPSGLTGRCRPPSASSPRGPPRHP